MHDMSRDPSTPGLNSGQDSYSNIAIQILAGRRNDLIAALLNYRRTRISIVPRSIKVQGILSVML